MGSDESPTEEVQSMYDNLVGAHKRIWESAGNQSIHYGYYEDKIVGLGTASTHMMELVADVVDIDHNTRVLVLGCGAGEDAVWIADEFNAEVVGVDLSEDQIELAREYAWERGVDELVTFHIDDFHQLPSAKDGSFDVVWALESVSHSHNLEEVANQCNRVLGEKGRVVFADWFVTEDSIADSDKKRLQKLDGVMNQWTDTLDKTESALTSVGFGGFDIKDVTEGVMPGVKHRSKYAFIMIPLSTITSAVGLTSAEYRDVVRGAYHRHELACDGVIGYYILSAK